MAKPCVVLLLLCLTVLPTGSQAQNLGLVVRDGTLGSKPAGVVDPGIDPKGQAASYLIRPELGRQVGANLFHSFTEFGVGAGETATFVGPDPISGPRSIHNILSRVTGENASSINGTLRSTVPGADVYLINPNGIVFGESSSLDVHGAFHASTAESVGFPNGESFEAFVDGSVPLLTVEDPASFGFLGDVGARIGIEGLLLNEGAIELRAGVVQIMGRGLLRTIGGHPVVIEATDSVRMFGTGSFPSASNPGIRTSTSSEADAGSITIRAPLIDTSGGSSFSSPRILAETSGAGNGGAILLDGSTVVVDGVVSAASLSGSTGDAGSVEIVAPFVTVEGLVSTASSGTGDAGSIDWDVARLTLRDSGTIDTGASSGSPGDVTIEATDSVRMFGTGSFPSASNPGIRTSTSSEADAGSITIRAPLIDTSGGSSFSSPRILAETSGAGNGGAILLDGSTVVVDGVVSAASLSGSTGDAGSVEIVAPFVTVEGLVSTASSGTGDAGSIDWDVARLTLRDSGTIDTGASSGSPGDVTIEATDSVRMFGTGSFPSASNPGIRTSTSSEADAGSITIRAPLIDTSGGSSFSSPRILAETSGAGNGGAILLDGSTVVVDGVVSAASLSGSTGDAGSVEIVAPFVTVEGLVSTASSGTGDAGSIEVIGGEISSTGRLSASALGTGDGGRIRIEGESLDLLGSILVDAVGGGMLGVVEIIGPPPEPGTITLDGSLGASGPVMPGFAHDGWLVDYLIEHTLGQQRGSNLFHSFEEFTVGPGEYALFTGPGSISNVIGRVTGGAPSAIDGTLGSSIPGASVFLLNPAGVLFGSEGRLDVSSSFHAATAGRLRLGSDGFFDVDLPLGDVADLADAPTGFDMLSGAPISLQGTRLLLGSGVDFHLATGGTLQADDFELSTIRADLSLMASDLQLSGNIRASETTTQPSGTIHLAGTDRVAFDGSIITSGGAVRIEGGHVAVGDQISTGSSLADSLDVSIVATEHLTIEDGFYDTSAFSAGRGGSFVLRAPEIELASGAWFYSYADDGGVGGDLSVVARDLLTSSGAQLDTQTYGQAHAGSIELGGREVHLEAGTLIRSLSNSGELDSGDSGSIRIRADERIYTNDAFILTQAFGGGKAGDITFDAGSSVVLEGGTQVSSETWGTGPGGLVAFTAPQVEIRESVARSIVGVDGIGQGGDVQVSAETLELDLAGALYSTTGGNGDGGALRIEATDSVRISGRSFDGSSDFFDQIQGVLTGTSGFGGSLDPLALNTGNAGDLFITTPRLSLENAGLIVSTSIFSSGDAGNVHLDVGRLSIGGGSLIDSGSGTFGFAGNIFIDASTRVDVFGEDPLGIPSRIRAFTNGFQGGGTIEIQTPSLSVDQGVILSTNLGFFGPGSGGDIRIEAASIEIVDEGFIDTSTFGSGPGGLVMLRGLGASGTLLIDEGGRVQSQTVAAGSGGTIDAQLQRIRISNGGEVATRAGSGVAPIKDAFFDIRTLLGENLGFLNIDFDAVFEDRPDSTGDGGQISLTAENIELTNRASVSAVSSNLGDAGTILVDAEDSVRLRQSSISTESTRADGGDIKVGAEEIIELVESEISASVQGGTGGNIDIDPTFVILNESAVRAEAATGQGGSVRIATDFLLADPESLISASSGNPALSGSVELDTPDTDLLGTLSALPENYLDAGNLLGARCSPSAREKQGSFVVAGPGMWPSPDGYLAAPIGASRAVIDVDRSTNATRLASSSIACH